eukprot:g3423.t1
MFCSTVSLLNTKPSSFQRRIEAFHPQTRRIRPVLRQQRFSYLERVSRRLRAGAETVAPDPPSSFEVESSQVEDIIRYLTTLGWEQAWIDGVTERIAKRQLKTTPEKLKAACEFLIGLGISEGQLCNMASLCYTILGYEVESHLQLVVNYLKMTGVKDFVSLLTMNPRLLDYEVAPGGSELVKGKLRAVVKVESVNGKEYVKIVTYREGAKFKTAPITPYAPLDVWQLAVSQHKTPLTNKAETNRQGWKAYYEVEKQKRSAAGKDDEPIHVPSCFRDAAAEDGVYSQDTDLKTPSTPAPTRDSEYEKLRELENTVFELSQQRGQLSSEKESLLQELDKMKIKEQDFSQQEQEMKSEITGLKSREQDFEYSLQELKAQNCELNNEIQELKSREQDLLSRLERQVQQDRELELKSLADSTTVHTQSVSEEVSKLQKQLHETTEKLEKSLTETEAHKKQNEAVLSKMKFAKQQFDKLKKQSHDRNVENENLKVEIEQLRSLQNQQSSNEESSELMELKSHVSVLEGNLQNAHDRIQSLQTELDQSQDTVNSKQTFIGQLESSLKIAEDTIKEKEALIMQLGAEIQSLTESAAFTESLIANKEIKNQELEANVTSLEHHCQGLEETVTSLQTNVTSLERHCKELETNVTSFEANVTSLELQCQEYGTTVKMLERQSQEYDANVTSLEFQCQELKTNVTSLEEQLTAKDRLLQDRISELEDLSAMLDQNEMETTELRNRSSQELQTLNESLASCQAELEAKTVQLDSIEDSTQHQLADKDTMIAKREQELLKLKEEFLEQLKQKEEVEEQHRIQDSEFDRLANQLQELLTKIDVLENANESIETELQDKTSALQNASSQLNILQEELKESQDSLRQFSDKESVALARIKELEDALESVNENEAQFKNRIQQLENALESANGNEAQFNNRIQQLEAAVAQQEQKESTLVAEVAELTKSKTEFHQTESELNSKVQELDGALNEALEIAELADKESAVIKSEKQQLLEALESKSVEIGKLESMISRKEIEVESLKTQLKNFENQFQETASELERLRHELTVSNRTMNTKQDSVLAEKQELMDRISSLEASVVEYRKQEENRIQELQNLKDRKLAADQELQFLKSRRQEIEFQLTSSQQSVHQLKQELTVLQTSLASEQRSKEELMQAQKSLQDSTGVSTNQLRDKIVRLETALAIAGQSVGPNAETTRKLASLEQRAAQAEARESVLLEELQSMRLALDQKPPQKVPPRTESGTMVGGMSNKKDEDRGYDVEAAVLSGGDPSGFQPLSGLLRGVPAMKYLTMCIKGADVIDRGFILLMRHPLLRSVLLTYFLFLHLFLFL